MMVRSIEDGRWTAVFQPRGRVTLLGTGFFAAWLCVWAAGEVFGTGLFLASLGHPSGSRMLRLLGSLAAALAPGLAGRITWLVEPGPSTGGALGLSFIATWLTIWTLAGVLAAYQLIRLHTSADRVAWDGAGVELVRRSGPFRYRWEWRAQQVEHVSMSRPDRALLLHTPRSTHALTQWGSKAERAAVRDEILKVLRSGIRTRAAGAGIPAGWKTSPAGEDAMLLFRDPAARRVSALAAWGGTVAIAYGAALAWYRGQLDAPGGAGAIAALLVIGACIAGSARLSSGGTRIVVRKEEIEFRGGPLAGGRNETLRKPRLSVEHGTDEDGDDWFELQARSGDRRRTIDRRLDEAQSVLGLARWIAERCEAPLDLGRGVAEYDEGREARAA